MLPLASQFYWQRFNGRDRFGDANDHLLQYEETKIRRHIKVIDAKSPFDGGWPYWAQRLQRDLLKSERVIKLLKQRGGKCEECGLPFTMEDVLEIHHRNGHHQDNRYKNLSLIHGHCHDLVHGAGTDAQRYQFVTTAHLPRSL